ncbi:MAG: MBL fold metallo-hydrolase [Mycoplasmatales bacterium]
MKILKEFLLGEVENNCFVIEVNNKIILIDAPMGSENIIEFLEKRELQLDYIFLTHTHYDHILGLDVVVDKFPTVKIYAPKLEQNFPKDPKENLSMFSTPYSYNGVIYCYDDININELGLEINYIPGHSRSSAVLSFLEDQIVFSGDTLFKGTIGRTDLPYGDQASLVSGIKHHIMVLDDETKVYPGHGNFTTVAIEKMGNPYFR